jgi:integrase
MSQRKRGQREGSIYKRSGDGYWVAAISLGNGQRKVVYDRTHEGALEKRDALKRALAQGISMQDGRASIGALFDAWLEAKRDTIRPKTYDRYASLVRCHTAQIAQIRLSKLTVVDIEALYQSRSVHVSPKTIRHLHFVIKAALAWAVRREWVSRNVSDLITAEDLPRMTRREMQVLSVEQTRSLMNAAVGTRAEALITFALVTGARVGEITGLTWERLNLETGRVKITHGLQFLDKKPTLVEPKTRAAVRELVLPAFAISIMRSHRTRHHENALSLGSAWSNPLDLVFVTDTGRPLNRHAVLRQYFRPLLEKTGLPESLRMHDLRHGAASLMLAQGVPVPVVAQLLGHATPAITMAIYSHALPDSQELVAAQMELTLAGNM